MTRFSHLALCAALPLLAACADARGDYPALMPTDQLLAEPALPPDATAPAATTAAAQARADALGTRADALRGPVIEPDARRRMQAAGQ